MILLEAEKIHNSTLWTKDTTTELLKEFQRYIGLKFADMKLEFGICQEEKTLLEVDVYKRQHQKEFETKQLGMVKEVLIEEKMHGKDHYYTGHTKEYIKVALYSEEPLENKIVKVKLRQILDDGYVLAEC